MPTPNSLPNTPNALPSPTRLDQMFGGSLAHSIGINQMLADILNAWKKVGVGAANQDASLVGPGRVNLTKLDATTEWLTLHLYNSLRNGGMERWALGTNIAVAAGVATLAGMGPDCWVLKTNAGQASHIIQSAGLSNGSQYSAVVARDAGQTGTGVMVYEHACTLDEIIRLRGQTVSLGCVLQANPNWSPSGGNITIRVACGTGAAARRGGTAYGGETTLIVQTVPITTAVATLRYISAVVVPTNATQMTVSFEWTPSSSPAGATDSVIIDDVMLVPGDVPMPFRARVDDAFECTRHINVLGQAGVSSEMFALGVCEATTTLGAVLHYPDMRVAPTISFSGPTDFVVGQAAYVTTAMSTGSVGRAACRVAATVASGLTVGQAAYVFRGTPAARIVLQAGV